MVVANFSIKMALNYPFPRGRGRDCRSTSGPWLVPGCWRNSISRRSPATDTTFRLALRLGSGYSSRIRTHYSRVDKRGGERSRLVVRGPGRHPSAPSRRISSPPPPSGDRISADVLRVHVQTTRLAGAALHSRTPLFPASRR